MKRAVALAILIGFLAVPIMTFADVTSSPVAGVTKELSEALREAIRNAEDNSGNEISDHEKIVAAEDTSMTEMPEEEKIEEAEEQYVIEISDQEFELLCIVTEAESGGCGVECRRLVVDTILNRVDDYGSVMAVLTAPSQFSCMTDGGIQRHSVPSESTVKVCKEELKHISNTEVYFFRDGHYHRDFGTPMLAIDDMFFSSR